MTDRSPGGATISTVFQSPELLEGILEGALVRLAAEYERGGAHQKVLALQAQLKAASAAPAEQAP